MEVAGAELTHLLILDDDAVLSPGALDRLVGAMSTADATAAYPAVMSESGLVGWTPGLPEISRRDYHRLNVPLALFRERCPRTTLYFTWAPGICLLVSRAAIVAAGYHRDDFWIRGEDLDFSLRITSAGRGVFVPEVLVEHLPPPMTSVGSQGEYLKHCAMLQNVAYIGCRLPHGHVIRKTIPGNTLRFLRTWGAKSLGDALRALWRGAVQSHPAGKGEGDTFLQRSANLHSTKNVK
ncbi:MAG: hypothetical protein JWL59_4026 [Chthoniobacteraceae bacterium]|nr:hypothetical protein [Chthoniobacteraceae bacterium]